MNRPDREAAGVPGAGAAGRMQLVSDLLLHPRSPAQQPWKYLLPTLVLAFVARAAIALSGDFVLHPDEIMQYLEPAHRLVFGNGAAFWEYLYGARSWLLPGLVAGLLLLFDAVGLGEPAWYVAGVKLVFCAVSLLIPAGMYFFARQHFGEAAARAALLAGAFWYELAAFAHKPMTEFVATALFIALLALCVRPAPDRPRLVWTVALLAVLVAAIRVQYAPLALFALGLFFLRTRKKLQLTFAATAFLVAVGVLDALTWDAGLFHSYIVNIRVNLVLGDLRAGESPAWQFLWWLALAGAGLSLLSVALGLRDVRRYGLLLGLIAVTLLIHSAQSHKEYRFIFVLVPLWLMIGADCVVEIAYRVKPGKRAILQTVGTVAATISVIGILNALPYQHQVYRAYSLETGVVGFIRNQDPAFPAYRYLARAPGVAAVWQPDRPYFNVPGYYYLHRKIPLYVGATSFLLFADQSTEPLDAITSSVTHIVTEDHAFTMPGYSVDRAFGRLRILRRDADQPAVRQWVHYAPTFQTGFFGETARRLYPDAPPVPPNAGIRFADDPIRSIR